MGNSFGIVPTLDKQHMHGAVRTKVDDCQVRLLCSVLSLLSDENGGAAFLSLAQN
jgi:hypothetical protein